MFYNKPAYLQVYVAEEEDVQTSEVIFKLAFEHRSLPLTIKIADYFREVFAMNAVNSTEEKLAELETRFEEICKADRLFRYPET